MEEPKIHVGITRRVRHTDGGHSDITINLSGIPATSSDSLIADMMMGRAQVALDLAMAEIEARVSGMLPSARVNPAAFLPPAPQVSAAKEPTPQVSSEVPADVPRFSYEAPKASIVDTILARHAERAGTEISDEVPFPAPTTPQQIEPEQTEPEQPEPTPEPEEEEEVVAEIPDATEVSFDASEVFGIEILEPPYEWRVQPLSITNEEGENGGQRMAINAALTSLGYGGKLRHPAILAILADYGPVCGAAPRETLESVNDLTKAEAHIVLSFIEKSVAAPESLIELAQATRIIKARTTGQEALNV